MRILKYKIQIRDKLNKKNLEKKDKLLVKTSSLKIYSCLSKQLPKTDIKLKRL